MPAIVTFDPVNLIIEEINVGGDNEIDAIEIYSEWKDWVLGDPQRRGYPQAFRTVGGDPTTPGKTVAPYFFLMNGWRLRPAELDHRLRVVGNVYVDETGDPINVPTMGNFNVQVETEVSPQAIVVLQGSGLSTQEAVMLLELWKRLSLDPSDPFVHTPSQMRSQSGDIVIDVTGDGETTSTGSRQ